MNLNQVTALRRLMEQAKYRMVFPHVLDEGMPLDVHVSVEVAHGYDDGNTYEARLWTPMTTLLRFPDLFYLRGDGKVYVYDSETGKCHEVKSVSWESLGKYSFAFKAVRAEEVLADAVG